MAKGKKSAKKKGGKRREKKTVLHGCAYIKATFNNTIITISDLDGNVLTQSSAGGRGFRGSRKSTPFAASQAAHSAASFARDQYGMRFCDVFVRGPGVGRESAGAGPGSIRLALLQFAQLQVRLKQCLE